MKRPFLALGVAFALVVLAFFASTVYSQYSTRDNDRAAHDISDDAMPSIVRLANARHELRRLENAVKQYLRVPTDERQVEERRKVFDDAIDAYWQIPSDLPEQRMWPQLRHRVAEMDHVIDRALDSPLTESERSTLRGQMDRTVERTSELLRDLINMNAEQAGTEAARIRKVRVRSDEIALFLDGMCVLLTLLVAFLAMRALRHYTRMQEERNRLERTRAQELETFAGRVAHDVLGPLSATSMALQLAKRDAPSTQARDVLERGTRGVRRVQTIVDGLLRFARAGAQPEPGVRTAVAPLIEEMVLELQPMAAQSHIELRADDVADIEVACNAGVLTSLLENLMRNAIKYMTDAPSRSIVVRVYERGDHARFEVIDSGPGIAPELLPRIFEPYVRGRHNLPGIGLGLATVRRMVEAHGGTVGVDSSPRGSRFWFELPRTGEAHETQSDQVLH
jgi:signal transduction histidine kinase